MTSKHGHGTTPTGSWQRVRAMLKKEFLQIRRDPSSLILALVMPVLLLFIFGYGVSLDAERIPIAVVFGGSASEPQAILGRAQLSRYFAPVEVHTMDEAETMIGRREVEGILRFSSAFGHDRLESTEAPVQLIIDGTDANRAHFIEAYVRALLQTQLSVEAVTSAARGPSGVQVVSRVWFNSAFRSRDVLVPGLLAMVMTLIGTLLTALVVAREWERGTMEAILVTPLRKNELLFCKLAPYFCLGMVGFAGSVSLGVLLFQVPLRGSFWSLSILSSLFLLAALGLGLLISSSTRNQFIAAQLSMLSGFLPTFFLSGLLFDLDSTPTFIQFVSHVVPARYYVSVAHTIFLAGDVWQVMVPNGAALLFMAIILIALARKKLKKNLER
ncbi:MAG: ABC transporter permease [Bdellovibrionota bacterium]